MLISWLDIQYHCRAAEWLSSAQFLGVHSADLIGGHLLAIARRVVMEISGVVIVTTLLLNKNSNWGIDCPTGTRCVQTKFADSQPSPGPTGLAELSANVRSLPYACAMHTAPPTGLVGSPCPRENVGVKLWKISLYTTMRVQCVRSKRWNCHAVNNHSGFYFSRRKKY